MKIANAVVMAALACSLAGPAAADERHRGHERGWHGEIQRFHEHDFERWRGGRWHHGWHDGRLGWWWIVGGLWYFYPSRVQPYPDPYRPPVVVVPPAAPVVVPPPAAPAAPAYWYYCSSPAGYYPYVPRCSVGWQPVPASAAPPMPPG